ncbi:MAG: PQQ-binding-like beta-propeller repeat protein [Roseovarius sp.]|nr:PQQ-binding-like beta-propeller repeat protein [uncultured Roseovarius sp.]MDX1784792.1 PQQ-binding-like beta-propeller repeat protein [Roseovarius sp.]
MIRNGLILGLAASALLVACSEPDKILQGERENIFAAVGDPEADKSPVIADAAAGDAPAPISLPPARVNSEWTQAPGSAAGRPEHPALRAAPQLIWSANIGSGDGARNRISADPVVAGGRVFALDSTGQASAHTTDGAPLWSVSLVPKNDSPKDGSGGGLAYGDGKLFVSTGFGRLTALDPATGAQLWEQELRQTATGNPAVHDGLVYLVAGDDVAWALDTDTGRIKWRLSATPDVNNIHGGPAPAISDKYAVFAFGSGELQGAFRKGGLRLWDAQIAGRRSGLAQSSITDVVGDPVIDGDRLYVGNSAGRMAALQLANGARIWSANEGPMGPVWPAGGDVFLVTDRNELVRLNGETGARVWGAKLPFFTKDRPRRQAEVYAHYGPVLAGGQLVVASNDGLLRFFDPVSGALNRTVEIPGGATTSPVVANNTLYVVSTKGTLHAFR